MSNQQPQKLSRRQRAKMRQEKEEKSIFLNIANNTGSGVDFFQQLLNSYSSDHKILELIERNSVLSTSVDLISTIVSSLDLNLYRRQRTGDFVPIKGVRHIDHILSKPNPHNTKTSFLYDITQNLLAFGHVYIVKAGKEFHVFQPREIFPEVRDGEIIGYRIPSIEKTIAPKLVLHIYRPSLNRKAYPSPVKNVIAEVLLNSDIIKQVTAHVRSGMMAKGVLKQDAGGNGSLSQNQMDAFAKTFSAATSGDRATGTIILPKGISYEAFAATVADSALTETWGLTRKQIIQSFKIPESVYTAEATSFASANVQEVAFMKNAIRPLCVMIQDAFNGWDQLTSETEYFQFEMGDLVSQEEEKFKADREAVQASTAMTLSMLSSGGKKLVSPNEIRSAAGLSKITDDAGNLIEEADDNPFLSEPTEPTTPQEPEEEELEEDDDNAIKKKDLNLGTK